MEIHTGLGSWVKNAMQSPETTQKALESAAAEIVVAFKGFDKIQNFVEKSVESSIISEHDAALLIDFCVSSKMKMVEAGDMSMVDGRKTAWTNPERKAQRIQAMLAGRRKAKLEREVASKAIPEAVEVTTSTEVAQTV